MKYVCPCGYVYDPAAGDPDNGVAPGTPWEEVPGLSLAAPPPASPPSPLPPPRPLPALGLCCRHHRDLLGLRWSAPRRRRPRL